MRASKRQRVGEKSAARDRHHFLSTVFDEFKGTNQQAFPQKFWACDAYTPYRTWFYGKKKDVLSNMVGAGPTRATPLLREAHRLMVSLIGCRFSYRRANQLCDANDCGQ